MCTNAFFCGYGCYTKHFEPVGKRHYINNQINLILYYIKTCIYAHFNTLLLKKIILLEVN